MLHVKNCQEKTARKPKKIVASATRKRRSFFIPHASGFNSIFDAYRNGTQRSRKEFEALFIDDFKAILKSAEIAHNKRSQRLKQKQLRSTKSGIYIAYLL